jgi:hypothetical protein
MSDILSTSIRKKIYDLFGGEVSSLGEYVRGRWSGAPTEGSVPVVGFVHDLGHQEQK